MSAILFKNISIGLRHRKNKSPGLKSARCILIFTPVSAALAQNRIFTKPQSIGSELYIVQSSGTILELKIFYKQKSINLKLAATSKSMTFIANVIVPKLKTFHQFEKKQIKHTTLECNKSLTTKIFEY